MDQPILDNLNRNVGSVITSLQALKSALDTASTGTAQPAGGGNVNMDDLKDILGKFVKDFKEVSEEQKKYTKSVVKAMKDVIKARSSGGGGGGGGGDGGGGGGGGGKKSKADQEEIKNLQSKLSLESQLIDFAEKNSFYGENSVDTLTEALKITVAQHKVRANALVSIQGISDVEKQALKTEYKRLEAIKNGQYAYYNMVNQLREITGYMNTFESGLGLKTMETLTSGIVQEEMKFTQEVRKAAYETAGLTKNSQSLQRTYEEIGTSVKTTGFDRTKFQQSYLKSLKSGVKDLKQAVSLTTTQLNTESQLGLEAGSLQETFQSFAQTGRMTNGQLADMGRGMRDVAKNTGLTGEALKGAVDSSREIINQLRNAASLTSTAAKNVIEMNANAKKLGVDQQMLQLQGGLTSGAKLLMDSSSQTQSMIFLAASKVGKVNEAMNGTLLSTKEGIKSLGTGLQGILKDFGVGSLEEIDQLSAEAKTRLNIQLKSVVGMELGEFRSLIESVNESGKGLGDRLGDINKKMKDNITADEKRALVEQKRQLKASKQLEILTALDEAAKGAKDMNGALAKFGERRKDFEGDLQALGSSWQNETQVAKDAIKGAIESVNKGLKEAGKSELKIDSSEIEKAVKDPSMLRELTAKISKGEQQLATAQKAQLDPVTETNQKLTEINDTLRNMSQNVISKIMSSIFGKLLVVGAVISGIAASVIGLGIQLIAIKKTLQKIAFGDMSKGESELSLLDNLKSVFTSKKPIEGVNIGKTETEKLTGQTSPTSTVTSEAQKKTKAETQPQTQTVAPKPESVNVEEKISKSSEILTKILTTLDTIKDCICKPSTPLTQPPAAAPDPMAALTQAKPAEPEPVQVAEKAAGKAAKKKKLTPEEIAALKAEGQARKEAAKAKGLDPAVEKSIRRNQEKNIKMDTKLNNIERKEQIKEIRRGKKDDRILRLEEQAVKHERKMQKKETAMPKEVDAPKEAATPCPSVPDDGCLDPKAMAASGGSMVKTAAAVAILAAGALVLGTALIFLGSKVLKALGLDLNKIMETAAAIAAVIGVAVAISVAGALAMNCLSEIEPEISKIQKNLGKAVKTGAILVVMGTILVILGAAMIYLARMVLKALNMDASTAIEVATTVGAIAGVVGTVAYATVKFLEALEELDANPMWKKIKTNYPAIVKNIALGGLALLVISGAIVILGAALIKFSQYILGALGVDAATAFKVGSTIAAIMVAVGLIALATIGSIGGLQALGQLTAYLVTPVPGPFPIPAGALMLLGADVLLKLGLPILLLATALMFFGKIILGAAGINAATAMKIGMTISAIFLAVGLISLALGFAMEGLTYLGAIATIVLTSPLVVLMELGAWALLLGGGGILLLGVAIMWLAKTLLAISGLNLASIAMTTLTVYALFAGVALISIALGAAMEGLMYLGAIAGILILAIPLMEIGARALLFFTPAMLLLASAIILMGMLVSKFIVSPKLAGQTAYAIATILGAAALIAAAVVGFATIGIALGLIGLLSPLIAGLMLPAAWGLGVLAFPMIEFVQAAVRIAKDLAGAMPLNKVNECVGAIASILGAALLIAGIILGFATIGTGLGLIGLLSPLIAGLMLPAAWGLGVLAFPMIEFTQAAANVAKDLAKALPPAQVEEVVNAVTTILNGAAKIGESVSGMIPSMQYMSMIGLIAPVIAWSMSGAGGALITLSKPLAFFAIAALYVAILLNSIMKPKDAEEAANAVTTILNGAASISDSLMKMVPKLTAIGSTALIMFMIAPIMRLAASALYIMSWPVVEYAKAIVSFAMSLASVVHPDKAKSLSQGVASMLSAIGEVSDEFQKIRNKIVSIGMGEGVFKLFLFTLPALRMGVFAFKAMKKPITDFIIEIVNFSTSLSTIVTPAVAKTATKTINATSEIIAKVSDIMKNLNEKIVPMTKAGWFTKSPVDILIEAKNKLATFFPAMFGLIKSIVLQVNASFTETQGIKSALKILTLIGMVVNEVSNAIKSLSEKVAPFVKKGWWSGKSASDEIIAAKTDIKNLILAIVDLMGTGIVGPIAKMDNIEEMKKAAKIMAVVAVLMELTGKAIKGMAEVVGTMKSGYIKKGSADIIKENKDTFKEFFGEVTKFIGEGIVDSISIIPDSSSLSKASSTMIDVARLLCATGSTIKSLAEVMKLMDPVSLFDRKSPMQKIVEKTDKFTDWFGKIGKFVKEGIVDPTNLIFTDSKDINSASIIIVAMAKIAASIVPMIKNLAEAVALATEGKGIFDAAPMKKIVDSKDKFTYWFEIIGVFVRDGIVKPTLSVMKDIDIGKATQIIVSMATIAAQIVPMIKNLASAVGLMSEGGVDNIDTECPVDRIISSKDKFTDFFTQVAMFMRDGIVNPILNELKDLDGIQKAARIMNAMNQLIIMIPQVINNFVTGLIPLVENSIQDIAKDTPEEKIKANSEKLKAFFTTTARFMREGIVNPILKELDDLDSIQRAARILNAMNQLLINVTGVIRSLVSLFGPLDPNQCLKEAPIQMISRMAPQFTLWFTNVALLMRNGILYPILLLFPSEEEMKEAVAQLARMIELVKLLPAFLMQLSNSMDMFSGVVGAFNIGLKVTFFASVFTYLADTLKYGVINPIFEMPTVDELDDAIDRMSGMADVTATASGLMKFLFDVFNDFSNSIGLYTIFFGARNTNYFADTFTYLADTLKYGVIGPILYMPTVDQLDDAIDRMNGMANVTETASGLMKFLFDVFSDFSNSIGLYTIFFGAKNTNYFADTFTYLANVFMDGIIVPIRKLPSVDELRDAVNRIEGMSNVCSAASYAMGKMFRIFGEFSEKTSFFGMIFGRFDQYFFNKTFTTMADSLKYGIIQPILKNMPAVSELNLVVDKLKGLVNILDEVQKIMNKMQETVSNIGNIGFDFNAIKEMPIDKLLLLANHAKKGLDIAQSVETSVSKTSVKEEPSVAATKKANAEISAIVENNSSNKNITSVTATPTSKIGGESSIQSKIAAKKASEEPQAAKITGKELTEISESSKEQTELTGELVELFKKFLDLMKPTSGGGGSGADTPSTGLNRIKGKPPKIYKATSGLLSKGPQRQVVNMSPLPS